MSQAVQKLADILRVFSDKENKRCFTSAVILAAGSGRRFGSEKGKKQFVPVCSVPVLVHTLRAFEASSYITEIVIVTSPEDVRRCEEYRDQYGFTKITAIVTGGDDRQSSAKKGFDAISEKAEYVAIHDGARCLITPDMIDRTVRAAYESGAAIAAEKSRDTVKRASVGTTIAETLDREFIWLAKTPQVFLANMYRAAVYTAEKESFRATDDSSLVERLGFKVTPVECGGENIKLTTPVDVHIAEAILRARAEEE